MLTKYRAVGKVPEGREAPTTITYVDRDALLETAQVLLDNGQWVEFYIKEIHYHAS
jgi:hypothetical protein